MGSKKGQLFLVAIVFMVGMIFVIQQALFQYTALDISEPLESSDIYIMKSVVDLVNQTMKETYYCNETAGSFGERLEVMKKILEKEQGKGIYFFDMIYDLDCSRWINSPPDDAPLLLTVSITGFGKDIRGSFEMYHIE